MEKETNISHGLRWGIIIGVVYCLILVIRYAASGGNPILFGVYTAIGYVIILILLLVSGFQRRKKLGGYIEIKDAFQAMFVAVLIFELFYSIFNFIYLNYINPDFFSNMRSAMELAMEDANMPQSDIDNALSQFDKNQKNSNGLGAQLSGYLISVVISGVIALIFALIVKKKPNPFQSQTSTDQLLEQQR
ncbi:MAG TPA: DUF4199 domain-containing protein [Chitinophagaceae bacterium]|jgi:hypothetical protein|nr:DUF4199 domain-containing protein [Chitinophagaceae bacterium]